MPQILLVTVLGVVCASLSPAPTVLSHYRNLALGDAAHTVIEQLQVAASDLKVLHDRPSLVQELTWRARPFVSGSTVDADPLAELILTFHEGRLARIVATYDRERTIGLTDADLEELLSEAYGAPLLRSTAVDVTSDATAQFVRNTISVWADADATLTLWREDYPRRIGLTIVSTTADAQLQRAIADGTRLAAEEAPERERARAAAAASASKDRASQIRRENKAKFKP